MSSVTSNSRMLWSFARDGGMPFSSVWASVNGFLGVPLNAVWFMVTVAFCLGLPLLKSTVAFSAVVSIATIGLYISYGIPILIRITYCRKQFVPGPFSLGRFSLPVGIIAVTWISFITVSKGSYCQSTPAQCISCTSVQTEAPPGSSNCIFWSVCRCQANCTA